MERALPLDRKIRNSCIVYTPNTMLFIYKAFACGFYFYSFYTGLYWLLKMPLKVSRLQEVLTYCCIKMIDLATSVGNERLA